MSDIREFTTGATRNLDGHKPDYAGFLSPYVVREFGRYMHVHRLQADGELRASDNWQKGIPQDVYMQSAFRHFIDWWSLDRGLTVTSPDDGQPVTIPDALCALLFNLQGYLHEYLKDQQ